MQWYLARDGLRHGPFEIGDLVEGARDGVLKPDDLVWCTGMDGWITAGDVAELWQPSLAGHEAIQPEPSARAESRSASDASGVIAPSGAATAAALPEQAAASSRSDATPAARGGFIARHWRGETALPVAFWVGGVLVGGLSSGLTHLAGRHLPRLAIPWQLGGLIASATISVALLIAVWQCVGIWRSAGKHRAHGGARAWAIAARLVVVAGVAGIGYDFAVLGGPVLRESLQMAVGIDSTPRNRFRILRGARELEIGGGLEFGTAELLAKFLDATPTIEVIHLNSVGGRLREGYDIARLIQSRGLKTYTATDCASACTIAFLGGRERLLGSKARLGFHSASIGGVDQSRMREINDDIRRTLERHGVPEAFIQRALATPADGMWYPRQVELVAAGIVSRIVDEGELALSGSATFGNRAAIETNLKELPLYSVLEQKDPPAYRQAVDRMVASVMAGRSLAEITAEAQGAIQALVVAKYLPRGQDQALHAYWNLQVTQMELLLEQDAKLCVAYLFPEDGRTAYDLTRVVPGELQRRILAALAEVVRTAGATPTRAALDHAEKELGRLIARLAQMTVDVVHVLGSPQEHRSEPKRVCMAYLLFYREILALPTERGAAIMRKLALPRPQR